MRIEKEINIKWIQNKVNNFVRKLVSANLNIEIPKEWN